MTVKLASYVLVLLLAITLNFLLPRLMPGTPLRFFVGDDVALLSQESVRELMAQHRLDRPLWEQYLHYLWQLVQGDLGYSYQERKPVLAVLLERLPWTLLLTGTALVLSTAIGVTMGALAAWRHGSAFDALVLSLFVLLDSMPSFWVGMIFIAVFAAHLGWFPIFGAQTPWAALTGWEYLLDILKHLVLPVLTLTLTTISGTFLVTRSAMLGVLGEDYIRTARSKGLSEFRVLYRHALRNGMLPVVTVFMINLGFLVSGATVVETVFSYPGLGRLLYEAVLQRDYPLMQGAFLLITVSVLIANLCADLLYSRVDPRVRV
ncbi:MAG: ABC transporter permease [Candidatus Bipolaricaulota bacterium]|nr:ABC transporter permease [Candidatus Bipolaricaulota bacterium]MDW8031623.1 ABC transporter permease [Candidatus Bipolaricaulota bacterium]